MQKIKAAIPALMLVVSGACQDLVVENTNLPDRRQALSEPDAVEALIGSIYPVIYNRLYRGTAGYIPLPMTGDEVTNSDNTSGGRDLSTLPRQPYDNNPVNTDQYGLASLFWLDLYESASNGTDALKVINDGLVITTGDPAQDNTHRARVIAKLGQGLALGYIGLLYDQGYVFDETTPDEAISNAPQNLELVPHTEITARAIALLDEAAQLAQQGADFSVPRLWFYAAADLTRADIVELANAFAVRFIVLSPRTPEERQAIDWADVLTRTSRVTKSLTLELNTQTTGQNNIYLQFAQHNTSSRRFYASNRLIGPADVSGKYQAWVAAAPEQRTRFEITTPDRRITGIEGPTTSGTHFRYVSQDLTNALYGTYRQSYYQWFRKAGEFQSGTFDALPLDEMNLYRAEAYFRLGQLQEAVDLINRTRVTNGQLPAVTTAGVPQDAACVPRTDAGECGSLLDALVYERMIELSFVDPTRTWSDRRGFGTLTRGTLLHLPIPRAQQQIIGLPYYTFGGSGAGSAQ